jgi:hypothetical protein
MTLMGNLFRTLGILAGLALAGVGLSDFALLLIGTDARASVDFSVRAATARNPYSTVYYSFETADGSKYKGNGSLPAGSPSAGALPIRYLGFVPSVNAIANVYSLTLYGALWLTAGALLVWLSSKKSPRSASRRR